MPMKKNLQMENISNIKTLCSSWNEDIIHDKEKYAFFSQSGTDFRSRSVRSNQCTGFLRPVKVKTGS